MILYLACKAVCKAGHAARSNKHKSCAVGSKQDGLEVCRVPRKEKRARTARARAQNSTFLKSNFFPLNFLQPLLDEEVEGLFACTNESTQNSNTRDQPFKRTH